VVIKGGKFGREPVREGEGDMGYAKGFKWLKWREREKGLRKRNRCGVKLSKVHYMHE
jgi:hypothetical protein